MGSQFAPCVYVFYVPKYMYHGFSPRTCEGFVFYRCVLGVCLFYQCVSVCMTVCLSWYI